MEFWGVEVPSGKPVACDPDDISYIHISQAALGERSSGEGKGERVVLKLTVDGSEFVIATLSAGKCEQTTFDLILDREFLISHNGSSSVYLTGYKTDAVRDEDFSNEDGLSDSEEEDEDDDEDDDDDDDDEEEDIPTPIQISANNNGKLSRKVKEKDGGGDKTTDASAKGKPFDININGKADEDNEDEDEDEDDDSDVDLDMLDSGSGSDLDSDESDDEDSSEEEDQAKDMKKRPFRGAQNPSAGKKNKVATPQEDAKPGKKGAKAPITTITPKQQHLQNGKKDKKTSAKENDAQPAIPNSGKKAGRFVCSPCNKNFNNESSLSQHMNAKHK